MIRTVCIYHGNCADGFTAAWAVRRALGEDIEFHPARYGEAPPDVSAADVVLVDFSYPRDVLLDMAARNRSVLVLDHHRTAREALAGIAAPRDTWDDHLHEAAHWDHREGPYLRALFDMHRSGAQLAWDFFHDATRPPLVDYVGDRDLWLFEMPFSREVNAWIFSHAYDFEDWHDLAYRLAGDVRHIAEQGAAILRKHDKDIDELIDAGLQWMTIAGQRVPVVNLPYTMASDAAGKLAEGHAFAACYFDRADARVFSLRSRGAHGADVSAIAKGYGGGGHRNAAGFQVPHGWRGE